MKYYLALILTINILTTVSGQSEPKDETEDFVKKFILTYQTDGHRKAFEELFKTNSYMVPSLIDSISAGIEPYLSDLGEYHGAERVSKWTYGKSLIVYAYFLKYNRQPIRIYFKFYKPKDKWMFLDVNYKIDFTDNLTKTLDEELKIKSK